VQMNPRVRGLMITLETPGLARDDCGAGMWMTGLPASKGAAATGGG
jgi:hypothetical protein